VAQEVLVVGLGIFGRSVALNLGRQGISVLAVDSDEHEVQAMAPELDAVICADATDEASLRELRPERLSCAVVAIGADSMESSILATALLRQLGVPRIVGRAVTELHARVLAAVGAHEVVSPETEMGQRLARRLAQPNVLDRLELADDAELAEVESPESFAGQSLSELQLRRQHQVMVVARRRGESLEAPVDPQSPLASGDILIVIGAPAAIRRLAALA
jgi:trk system potassium uptake protein TrkA